MQALIRSTALLGDRWLDAQSGIDEATKTSAKQYAEKLRRTLASRTHAGARIGDEFARTDKGRPKLEPGAGRTLSEVFGAAFPKAALPKPGSAPIGLVHVDELEKLDDLRGYGAWLLAQFARIPEARRAFEAIKRVVRGPAPPATVAALIARSFEVADQELGARLEGDPNRDHAVALITLFALSGHAMPFHHLGSAAGEFPPYLSDGREIDAGFDKTQHLLNQAMFSYVLLYDRFFSSGEIATRFEGLIDRENYDGRVDQVLDVHHGRGFRVGPLHPSTVLPPTEPPLIFPRAVDLSPDEDRAARYTERVGALHELHTTNQPELGKWSAQDLGKAPGMGDPRAPLANTIYVTSGLGDAGVRNELESNYLGGLLGIALMRNPRAALSLTIPYDGDWGWAHRPYGPGLLTWPEYCGIEAAMIARVLPASRTRGDRSAKVQQSRAESLGLEGASSNLETQAQKLVAALANDRPRLASYYANFCIRHLAVGVGDSSDKAPTYEGHYQWAMNEKLETVAEHNYANKHNL
jgi:hypothetical protein